MTQCLGIPAEEMAERYLAGGLSEAESEQFENHYFGCEPCHEQLLALQELRDGLIRESMVMATTASLNQSRNRGFVGRLLAFPVPVAVLGSIAATLVFGAVLVGIQRSGYFAHSNRGGAAMAKTVRPASAPELIPAPSPDPGAAAAKSGDGNGATAQNEELASLADLRLPGFEQPQLRDGEPNDLGHEAFSLGMTAYTKGDCGKALSSFEKVPETAADGVAAELYSGLCRLRHREPGRAQANFARVIAAGDTPQLETAEYFQAQAKLLQGDRPGAASWLRRTIALHGDYEARARTLNALLTHTKANSH